MFEMWDFDYWYLKWIHQEKTGFANIAGTTCGTSKQVNLYTRQDFKSSGIGSLYEKKKVLNELITNLMLKFSLQNLLQSFKSLFLIWCERLPIYGNLK